MCCWHHISQWITQMKLQLCKFGYKDNQHWRTNRKGAKKFTSNTNPVAISGSTRVHLYKLPCKSMEKKKKNNTTMQYTDCHSFLNANATKVANRLLSLHPNLKWVCAGHNNIQTNVSQSFTILSKDRPLTQNHNTLCLITGNASRLSGENMAT